MRKFPGLVLGDNVVGTWDRNGGGYVKASKAIEIFMRICKNLGANMRYNTEVKEIKQGY